MKIAKKQLMKVIEEEIQRYMEGLQENDDDFELEIGEPRVYTTRVHDGKKVQMSVEDAEKFDLHKKKQNAKWRRRRNKRLAQLEKDKKYGYAGAPAARE